MSFDQGLAYSNYFAKALGVLKTALAQRIRPRVDKKLNDEMESVEFTLTRLISEETWNTYPTDVQKGIIMAIKLVTEWVAAGNIPGIRREDLRNQAVQRDWRIYRSKKLMEAFKDISPTGLGAASTRLVKERKARLLTFYANAQRWPQYDEAERAAIIELVQYQIASVLAAHRAGRAPDEIANAMPSVEVTEAFAPYFEAFYSNQHGREREHVEPELRALPALVMTRWWRLEPQNKAAVLRVIQRRQEVFRAETLKVHGANPQNVLESLPTRRSLEDAMAQHSLARISHRSALWHNTTKPRWEAAQRWAS
ncbi:hypothetical protein JCM11641_001638 [Rhodosporidiobolus odoratus]